MAGDDRPEREAIDVVDLSSRERVAGLDDFVAGGKNRHTRLGEHFDGVHADRCDRTQAARIQQVAAPHDEIAGRDVRTAPTDVLSWVRSRQNFHVVVVDPPRFLEHHDGVAAVGQRRTSGDFRALAAADAVNGRVARKNALGDRQRDWCLARGAGGVRCDDGVTVHR